MSAVADTSEPALSTVLVTGASSGIGAALVPVLAGRGCRVIAAGRDRRRLDEVVVAANGIVDTCVGDVADPEHRALLASTLAERPGPRGVVHLAGSFQTGLLDGLDVAAWRRSLEVNVEARFALSIACRHALDGGRLLFIGSDAGASPRVGAGLYSIAQSASETLRRVLQAEWDVDRCAVGSFKPGLVDTEMVRGFMALPTTEFPARAAYEEYIAAGRIAAPGSVARFAAWLLLDVERHEFATTEWDIRDEHHHTHWATDPLYPHRH